MTTLQFIAQWQPENQKSLKPVTKHLTVGHILTTDQDMRQKMEIDKPPVALAPAPLQAFIF